MLDGMSRRLAGWAAALGASAMLWPALAQAQNDEDDGNWGIPASGTDAASEAAPSASPATPQNVDPADADPQALTAFRTQLDSHGTWVNDSTYGTVWVPNRVEVGADFAPYVTAGHWALDQNGDWIWVSDYPFGNVVFHYGRWVWIGGTGWVWVPGYTYAPAWVVWRTPVAGYDYVGWAPAPPAWVWFGGVGVSLWITPPLPYVFCPSVYVFYPRPYAYIVHDRWRAHEIARHTSRYYAAPHANRFGPTLSAARVPAHAAPVSRVTARPIPSTPVRSSARGPGIARARPGLGAPASPRQPTQATRRPSPDAGSSSPAPRRSPSAGPAPVQAGRSTGALGAYRPPSGTPSRAVTSAPRASPAALPPSYSRAPANPTSRSPSTPRVSASASSPAPRVAAPAARPAFQSAPSSRSAPAATPRYSAPAYHGSGTGGGVRGGGGAVRSSGRGRR
jgi:hypothetical protein